MRDKQVGVREPRGGVNHEATRGGSWEDEAGER
jgi:hypothetical protein